MRLLLLFMALAWVSAPAFELDDNPFRSTDPFAVKPDDKPALSKPADVLASIEATPATGVSGWIRVVDINAEAATAVIEVTYIPPPPTTSAYHLYSTALPIGGLEGIGRPTLVEVAAGQPVQALARAATDAKVKRLTISGFTYPVYEPGPVQMRLPVRLPQGDGTPVPTELLLTYMACNDESCLMPVTRKPITVALPSFAHGYAMHGDTGGVASPEQEASPEAPAAPVTALDSLPRGEWLHPQSAAELSALIQQAADEGKSTFLDFTGPSCLNCQVMAKTVFRTDSVQQSFSDLVLIEINTDPPNDDLAAFQQTHFQTQARPYYAVIPAGESDLSGAETWSEFFAPSNEERLAAFNTYLTGGLGSNVELGGFWALVLAAVLGGLFTLIMPCTYPMIPFTINFFAKQSEQGAKLPLLGAAYAIGIIVFFVGLGVLLVGVMGSSPQRLAGDPVANMVIALLFLVLGLSLLGVLTFRLPSGLVNSVGGGRGGYVGALLMGLTFAITAFSCTAPVAGTVLAQAATTGSWLSAILTLTLYAAVIAIPFFLLALSPKLLQALPKAGAWMNEFKVVGGIVEIGAAVKFLVIADYAWGWDIFDRSTMLTIWTLFSLFVAVYVLGWFRTPHDSPVLRWHHPVRLLVAASFAGLAVFFIFGLAGSHLGMWEGLFVLD